MTSSVTAPLEAQFGQMPGLNQMTSISSAGASVDHAAVRPRPRPRRRRAGSAGRDQCRRQPAARRPARAADLRQGQPGRRADPDAGDRPRRPMPLTQVEDFVDTRLAQKISQLPGVGPGQHQRRPAAGGADPRRHPQRSPPTASISTICAPRSPTPTSTRPRAISTARRAPTPSTPTTRSAMPSDYKIIDRRLQERLAGAAVAMSATSWTAPRTTSSAPG